MRYYTHATTAVAGAVFLSASPIPLFEAGVGAASLGGVLLGSLLPDIDETGSWLGRRTKPLAVFIKALFGHRGLTHSGIVLAPAIYGFLQVEQMFISGLLFGIAAHILADLLSYGGVPLFYPFNKKRTSIPVYKTGSLLEKIIFLGSSAYILLTYFPI
ncbi:metal-dependent hydrolase [Alkalicoccus halolimnae]|uniref:Metal-dependent hydrolase n=1 Tax=Alkalicoccus halolimnae TaxID=1667239 RepID=A0AAJ8N2M5_9BACI|nr:metal-dependent hydrolase [Alkalicoccus halolimnae]